MKTTDKIFSRIVAYRIFISAFLFVAILGTLIARYGVTAEQILSTVTILPSITTTTTGAIDYQSFATAPVSIISRTPRAGAESIYEVALSSGRSIPVGGSIVLYFPSGFSFSSSCSTPLSSTENSDINGPASGTVTIVGVSCNTAGYKITITTGGAQTAAGDIIRFLVQGVINSYESRGPETSGYLVGIETRDANGASLEIKTALPFFLSQAGTQRISGTVFLDNGAGLFGFSRDGVQSGSEPGIIGAQVCLSGPGGISCQQTDSQGGYLFTSLTNGYYSISAPQLAEGDIVGGPFYADVQLSGGQNRIGLNFAFLQAERSITASISNIPAGQSIDVFASGRSEEGGFVVRTLTWNGQQSRSVSVPVSDGVWDIGVGPALSGNLSLSTSGLSLPFMPPQPQQVNVSGSGAYTASFILLSAEKLIKGKVVDGAGTGIPNVFVLARPSTISAEFGKEAASMTLSDGSFEIKVAQGAYMVEASMPGMPAVKGKDVSVRDDTGNSALDNNTTADVYSAGVLMTNDGDSGSDNFVFTIAKGQRSISGRALDENGNPIAYAHVSAEELDEYGGALGAFVDAPTDATGAFTLFAHSGTWKVRAFAPLYGELPSRTVTVAGQNLSGQDLRVSTSSFGTVRGTITKAGRAVSGAFVNISGPSGVASATTSADGGYTLRVRQGSGYIINAYVNGAGNIAPIQNVTVASGATLSEQNFTIATSGTISVTITGVTDAFVDARDAQFNGDGTTSNTTPGVYTLTLSPGTYTVRSQNARYGTIGMQENVVVQAGRTTSLTFTPPQMFTVRGRIVSSASSCVDSALVFVVDTINGRMDETTSSSSGEYSFTAPNGNYTLTASKPGCVDASSPLSFIVSGASVSLSDRRLTQATASVSGAVQLAGANVTSATMITAESSAGAIQTASVNTANITGPNYSLNLLPGTWIISARSDGYQSSRHTLTISSATTLNMSMAAIPGYVATEREIASIAPAQGGIVKNDDAGATFAVVIPAGALGSSSTSGSVSTKVTTAVVTKTATAEVVGGKGIEITPKDSSGKPITTFSSATSDVKITMPYSRSDVVTLSGDETKLMLAVWSDDKQQWTPFATTVDTANATLSGVPPHFSIFAPIVPTASPTASASSEPPASVSASQQPASSIVSGTILVQPQKTAVPERAESRPQEEKSLITLGPTLIEQESSERAATAQPVGKTQKEKTIQIQTAQKTISEKRPQFPVLRRAFSSKQLDKKFTSAPEAPDALESPDVFELSIAIDNESREVITDSDVRILGELLKSSEKAEPIIIRYVITDAAKTIIAEQQETLSVGARISFFKVLHIGAELPSGFYIVSAEAQYQNKTISSSDVFQVIDRIPRPQDLIVKPSLESEESKQTIPVAFFLLVFALLIIGGFAQMWYTIKKSL